MLLRIFLKINLLIFAIIFLFSYSFSFPLFSEEVNLIYKSSKNKVRIVFYSEEPFSNKIFSLSNPSRLVVDFKSKVSIKNHYEKVKFIKNHRIGISKNGMTRVVFDLSNKLNKYIYTPLMPWSGKKYSLILDLFFGASVDNLPKKAIVVVVDPGHGGKDPGASRKNIKEKNITLLAAKYLKRQLESKGYTVFLTRNDDRFIRLANRVKFARKKSADLFISIHADSTFNKKTRGLSIYSLSEKASDRLAQSLADAENKVDLIDGIALEEYEEEVSDILIDIERRDTKNSSIEFAELVIKKFRNSNIYLLTRSHRQAGFVVLKAPDIPSVLIEMGFMSNRLDFELLVNKEYRRDIMNLLCNVIDQYLGRKFTN